MKIAEISRNPNNIKKKKEKKANKINFETDFFCWSSIHICARMFVNTSNAAYIYGWNQFFPNCHFSPKFYKQI